METLLRDLAPRVLAIVSRQSRDFGIAEDAVQEALLTAAQQWPRDGTPENPRAWLVRVALRRVADIERSAAARRKREETLALHYGYIAWSVDEPIEEEDDTLDLFFLCAHPALSASSSIALMLRALGGLTTAAIARAFLVPEATMAQRISRAKQQMKHDGIASSERAKQETAQRLPAVLHVLYLMFNEGYTSSAGDTLQRPDLAQEAIRLTRMLRALRPTDGNIAGLLALMLLTDARREARTDASGALVPLAEQDRSRWNKPMIREGVELLEESFARGTTGMYQLLAAIGAVHDEAPSADETDWPQILALYEVLSRLSDNPIVALNHAVAIAMVHGARAGIERLDTLASDARMQRLHRLDAVRAHLLEMAGDRDAAIVHYRRAAERTASTPERDYLMMQAARLDY